MKCEIVKDLLPLYIDAITSEESKKEIEEHLKSCKDCKTTYEQMIGQLNEVSTIMEVHEVDYLKKIKRRNIKNIIITSIGILILISFITKLFIIGFPVSYEDITMSYEVKDDIFLVDFELKNGYDLIFSSKTIFVYDDEDNIIESKWYNKPKWVFNNPFDDVGNTFSLGFPNSKEENKTMETLIIEFKDKTAVFKDGKLLLKD